MSASKAVIAKRTRRNQQSKRKAKERRQQPLLAMPDDRPLEPGVLTPEEKGFLVSQMRNIRKPGRG